MPRKPKKPEKQKSKPKPPVKRRGKKDVQPGVGLQISPKIIKSVSALFFYLTGLMIILSFFGDGLMLQAISRITGSLFGWGTVFLPIICFLSGNMVIIPGWRISRPTLLLGTIILTIMLISLTKSGSLGSEFWASIAALISGLGAFFVFLSGVLVGVMVFFEISLADLWKFMASLGERLHVLRRESDIALDSQDGEPAVALSKEDAWQQQSLLKPTPPIVPPLSPAATGNDSITSAKDGDRELVGSPLPPAIPGAAEYIWRLPPLSLLSSSGSVKANQGDVKRNAQTIEDTLRSFGVQSKVREIKQGPAVTQYAIELAIGTKLTKVTSLANDMALALAARTGQIRIEAPIPGKALVGIEVPNITSSLVSLRELLSSPVMKTNHNKLLVGLGLDVAGNHVAMDITKLPHLLIAGQTGSGKSVCINVLLMSILFRSSPNEVKLILVDPKRVEMTAYNGIPHLLTPVIVEPEKVVSALKWALAEMDSRYKQFAEVGARNIETYNEMAGFQAMPYIVIVIDELADIMLYAPAEVEDCINRLAQMARATGIHLVLATQRPSVDVITGLIKANIPARIAFSVSSMMDSRVVMDSPGAEKLLGKGDMLFQPPDQPKPRRIQGAYVTDTDTKNLTDFLKNNGVPTQYTEEITSKYKGKSAKGGADESEDEGVDELFEDVIRFICAYDKASASLLQRRFKVGYNRAARIIDQLYASGVVSAPDGAKPRDVLIKNADDFLAKRAANI